MKKLLSVILAVTMLISVSTSVFANESSYSDWAKESIEKAKELSIIGEETNNYTEPITRGEFCEFVYNYCRYVIKRYKYHFYHVDFTDTDSAAVNTLHEMGIVNGKTETEFKPNDFLTREEAAVILTRLVNKTIPVPVTEMYFAFDDETEISDWAIDSVQVMCNMGVMNGVGDNKFAPKDTYTTEQAIATIVRIYDAQNAQVVVTDTVKIDGFYIEKTVELINESVDIAADEEFGNLFVYRNDYNEYIQRLNAVAWEKPTEIYCLDINEDLIVETFEKMYSEEFEGELDFKKLLDWQKFNYFETFSMEMLTMDDYDEYSFLSALSNKSGYVKPKDFKESFALLLQYDSQYGAFVSFYEYGNEVIMAKLDFVKNCGIYDIMAFSDEISQELEADIITVSKAEY